MPDQIERDTLVQSTRFGDGRVLAVADDLVIVKFMHGIEQVLRGDVTPLPSVDHARAAGTLGDPLDAVVRLQAMAIRSVNDRWGVFSRSRVQLLPHQLWVCKRVRETWPFRFLVADDVGLGKTIEAGLVITPLVASGVVRRLLVLTPASLAEQWQRRLKDMFDIRLSRYVSEIDDARGDFWAANQMVVASFHTLRDNRRGQRERLLQAEPWDLVVVDEAHHLNADPRSGPTLAYALVEELERRQRISALLFFSGTPHRGKDFGFLALMRLVRPDLFDPERPMDLQLPRLRDAMIRNNKMSATDLEGHKLFTPVTVQTRGHGYSPAEDLFYRTMSEFVLEGRAYAASLTGREQSARMLLLVALQKLAASSIAAISAALRRRREMLSRKLADGRTATTPAVLADPDPDSDEAAVAEEARPGDITLLLLEDEMQRLDELLHLADAVTAETKIERLLDFIAQELPPGESLLLFTEYKATQAVVVNALHRRFGWGCAMFINGDERLDGVIDQHGTPRIFPSPRGDAAEAFNSGRVRFLVSTEAAGEGIDLQEHCATLVHVDLPWNPMRLHQRVGRLSRYGQTREVSVYIFRNPDTVEARIWDLLNRKLERVQSALASVMDTPEDVLQLVLGMSNPQIFTDAFAGALGKRQETLAAWFDNSTATLGGEDVLDFVRRMVGSVDSFDFGRVGGDVPKVDLPDLEAFFLNAAARHRRRVFRRDDGLDLPRAPDAWISRNPAVQASYTGLVLDRRVQGRNAAAKVLGVGHTLLDTAVADALAIVCPVARIAGLATPLVIVGAEDELTGGAQPVARLLFGARYDAGDICLLRDWELLQALNRLRPKPADDQTTTPSPPTEAEIQQADELFDGLQRMALPLCKEFRRPVMVREALLLPG